MPAIPTANRLVIRSKKVRHPPIPPGISYEYQNKRLRKFAFRNCLILKDASLAVSDLQRPKWVAEKKKGESKLPHSKRSNLRK